MAAEHRSLLMRANRLMGAQLVEHNFVKLSDLEAANERLLEMITGGEARRCTVLGILAYDLKVIREEDILMQLAENEGLSLIDLRHYEVSDDVRRGLDTGACWATWSVPFDREDDVTFVASAYWLSPAVRTYWEKQLGGTILWCGTTLDGVAEFLEKVEKEDAAPSPAAAVA